MDELLKKITNKSGDQLEERGDSKSRTLIVIYRNNKTLKSFQRQYLSFASSIVNDSTIDDFLSFSNIKLDNVSMDTYYCLFGDDDDDDDGEGINFIEMVKIFLASVREKDIYWIILLDWSIYDQQRWLDHILKCVTEIDSRNTEGHAEGNTEGNEHIVNKTVMCINSEHIYMIQKNLPAWYSHHIDYIQQTLRWYSLQKHCNLIYSETGQTQLDKLIKKIVNINNSDKFGAEDVEMAKTTRIIIPYGCDNIKLIKTLDETFNEQECTTGRYKEVIPAPIDKDRQTRSIFTDSIEPNVEYFNVTGNLNNNETTRHRPEFIDEQIQYRKLLEYSKKLNRQ